MINIQILYDILHYVKLSLNYDHNFFFYKNTYLFVSAYRVLAGTMKCNGNEIVWLL